MQTPIRRRFRALPSSSLAASAVLILAVAGCSIHASGGAKAGSDAKSKSSDDGKASASASDASKSKSSVKVSSSSSTKSTTHSSGTSSFSASGSAHASGKWSAIFKAKPRTVGLAASTKTTKVSSASHDLILKAKAGATVKVVVSAKGAVSVKPSKAAVKTPKPTTPVVKEPTKEPKPTTPVVVKEPTKEPKPPKEPKPTPTPKPEPETPVIVPIDPPEEPPDNVFGYPEPVKGCFEGLVYPLAANTPKLPTSYSGLTQISVLYACEWDIPQREWSTGFPGVDNYFEWFAIHYSGSFAVATAGTWNFRISSDDGAKLWIDGKVVIDNDGTHPPQVKDGSVELTAGDHEMVLDYFQGPRYLINLQLYATPPGGQEGIFSVR